MTMRYSEIEVVTTVTRLTQSQLSRFIEAAFIKPQRASGGYVFHPVDVSRLELLCDLEQDLELDETALGIVISLIDQLHAARRELADMASAIGILPTDLQAKIMAELKQT